MSSRIAVLLLALWLSGCVSIEMGRLAREVEQEVDDWDREVFIGTLEP